MQPTSASVVWRLLAGVSAENDSLLNTVFEADLAAFAAQSPQLAQRYRAS